LHADEQTPMPGRLIFFAALCSAVASGALQRTPGTTLNSVRHRSRHAILEHAISKTQSNEEAESCCAEPHVDTPALQPIDGEQLQSSYIASGASDLRGGAGDQAMTADFVMNYALAFRMESAKLFMGLL